MIRGKETSHKVHKLALVAGLLALAASAWGAGWAEYDSVPFRVIGDAGVDCGSRGLSDIWNSCGARWVLISARMSHPRFGRLSIVFSANQRDYSGDYAVASAAGGRARFGRGRMVGGHSVSAGFVARSDPPVD